jgi:HEPN domain-containing protein
MTQEVLTQRIEHLVSLANQTIATRSSGYPSWVDGQKFSTLKSGSLSFIKNVYGGNHPYYKNFEEDVTTSRSTNASTALGILQSIKTEIENGWLSSLKGLVAIEIFTDLIEQAEYFLEEGYKDPAAIMAGSVLEEHLKRLCSENGLEISVEKNNKRVAKKASLLNAELAKASVYSKLDSKLITAWQDLRNNAAHGNFEEYNADQVSTMITGIIEFVSRTK